MQMGMALSPKLELLRQAIPSTKKRLCGMASRCLQDVLLRQDIVDDLKTASPTRQARPIDIRGEDNEVHMKAYVAWDKDRSLWVVMLELPEETHWDTTAKEDLN